MITGYLIIETEIDLIYSIIWIRDKTRESTFKFQLKINC